MWLCTTIGFFSAVEHRGDPEQVLVRARCKEDIDALAELLPSSSPWEDEYADYRWRLQCSKTEWAETCAFLALDIQYDNFKSAVKSEKHKNAYMRVWTVLLSELQGWRYPSRSSNEPLINADYSAIEDRLSMYDHLVDEDEWPGESYGEHWDDDEDLLEHEDWNEPGPWDKLVNKLFGDKA